MRFPGLIDVHVHLRTPGGEHKEDFRTGSAAALAGGFTTLLAMPNTQPPLVSSKEWTIAQTRAKQESLCDVFLFGGGSEEHIDALPELAQRAIGLKIYLNETYGPLRVDNIEGLDKIVQSWHPNKPIAFHAEGESEAIAIAMAARYQQHVHICHVSRKSEIERIADAKARGLKVTCEVTPHHLFLSDADTERLGSLGDMRPRLAPQSDVDALWEHINTTIDCVASDHAPHTLAEKGLAADVSSKPSDENTPPGVPGLESTMPLLLTAAFEGRLSYERIIELLYTNPRRIYHLPEQHETWVEVDPTSSYTFPDHPLYTKCGWSPFTGRRMTGQITEVIFKGKTVYKDGNVLSF